MHGAGQEALVIGGDNLSVEQTTLVFAPIADTTQTPAQPAYPSSPGSVIPVVAADDHTLQVVLPASMQAGQSYVLWPVNTDPAAPQQHSWGSPILLNDARPQWISPSWLYATAHRRGLGTSRAFEVIGRNLAPAPGTQTLLCFVPAGSAAPTATSPCPRARQVTSTTVTTDPTGAYRAQFQAPPLTEAASYRLYIRRDGASWVDVPTPLAVRRDPVFVPSILLSSMATSSQFQSCGDPLTEKICRPNDNKDDSCCILNALEQARASLATTTNATIYVVFDDTNAVDAEGWLVDPPASFATPASNVAQGPSPVPYQGFAVPSGVNLIGASDANTRRSRVTLRAPEAIQLFGLASRTSVSHMNLRTHRPLHEPWFNPAPSTISLGDSPSDQVITDTVFEPIPTLAGAPNRAALKYGILNTATTSNLVVTNNSIAADSGGVALQIANDTVITGNTVVPGPGSFAEGNDAIAISWGGGSRNNISANILDGTDTTYATESQRQGFRAGIYAHTYANHDRELIANNQLYCSGFRSKDGPGNALDGEGISFDENGTSKSYAKFLSSSTSIRGGHILEIVDSALELGSCSTDTTSCVGMTVTIVSGQGQGQARRVDSASRNPTTNLLTLTVHPAFDVAPLARGAVASPDDSAVVVARSQRQLYVIGNRIDNQSRGARACPIAPRSQGTQTAVGPAHNGGMIFVWGSDWVVAHNTLQSTSGIGTRAQYTDWCYVTTPMGSFPMTSMWGEIRDNRIFGSTASFHTGGIVLRSDVTFDGTRIPGASTCQPATSQTVQHLVPYRMGIGVSVARNSVETTSDMTLDTGNDFKSYPGEPWATVTKSAISVVGYSPGAMAWSPGYSFSLLHNNAITYTDGPVDDTHRYGIVHGDLMSPNGAAALNLPLPDTTHGSGNQPLHTLECGNTVTDPSGLQTSDARFHELQPTYDQTTHPAGCSGLVGP